jgi:ribosome-associated toxin RatA of RatAB toxin-antitoxin module
MLGTKQNSIFNQIFILTFACMVFSSVSAAWEVDWLKDIGTENMTALLEKGEVILLENPGAGGQRFACAGLLIDAPREEVWKELVNWERHREFMPNVTGVKQVKDPGGKVLTETNYAVEFPLFSFTAVYTLEHALEPPFRDSYEFVKGDIKDVRGCWELHPVDGGKKTAAFHRTWWNLKSMGYLAKSLYDRQPALEISTQMQIAALTMSSFKEWVETPATERGKKKGPGPVKETVNDPVPTFRNMNLEPIARMLKHGDVTIVWNTMPGHRQFITSGARIGGSVREVYDTTTDFTHYPEFMPQIEKGAFRPGKNENEGEVDFRLKIMVGPIPFTYEYTFASIFDPPNGWRWTLARGDLKDVAGSWEIYRAGGEGESVALYTLYADMRSMGRVVQYVLDKQPEMELSGNISSGALSVKAVKERVEKKAGTVPVEKPRGVNKGKEEKF